MNNIKSESGHFRERIFFWSRLQGAGVRRTPLCIAQKHRPRRERRLRTCGIFGFAATLRFLKSLYGLERRAILTAALRYARSIVRRTRSQPHPKQALALLANKKAVTFQLLLILVEATGCGCPGDTSVLSTEAPTEAGAETSNLRHLRLRRHLAVPKIALRLGAPSDFDRCASLCSLHRPQDALATSPKASALPSCATPRF